MRYRGKVINSAWNTFEPDEYCPGASIAELVKMTPYGIKYAIAETDVEDFEWGTSWDGFRICEHKIELQVIKERIRDYRQRLKGMKMLYNGVVQGVDIYEEREMIRRMERQIEALNYELQDLIQEYKEKSSSDYLYNMVNEMKQAHINAEKKLERIKQAKEELAENED